MKELSTQISHGNLEARTNVPDVDELIPLANNMNLMIPGKIEGNVVPSKVLGIEVLADEKNFTHSIFRHQFIVQMNVVGKASILVKTSDGTFTASNCT